MSMFMLGVIVSNIVLGFIPSEKVKADDPIDMIAAANNLGAQFIIPEVKDESKRDRTILDVVDKDGKDKNYAVNSITESTLDKSYDVAEGKYSKSNPVNIILGTPKSSHTTIDESNSNKKTEKRESKLRRKLGTAIEDLFKGKNYTIDNAYNFYVEIRDVLKIKDTNGHPVNKLGLDKSITDESTVIWASYSNINNGDEDSEDVEGNDVNSYIEFISVPKGGNTYKYTLIKFKGLMKRNGKINVDIVSVDSELLCLNQLTMVEDEDRYDEAAKAAEDLMKQVWEDREYITLSFINNYLRFKCVRDSVGAAWDNSGIYYWLKVAANKTIDNDASGSREDLIGGTANIKYLNDTGVYLFKELKDGEPTKYKYWDLGKFQINSEYSNWGVDDVLGAGENNPTTSTTASKLFRSVVDSYAPMLASFKESPDNINEFFTYLDKAEVTGKGTKYPADTNFVRATLEYWVVSQLNGMAKQLTAVKDYYKNKNLDLTTDIPNLYQGFADPVKGLVNFAEYNLKYNADVIKDKPKAIVLNRKEYSLLEKYKNANATGSAVVTRSAMKRSSTDNVDALTMYYQTNKKSKITRMYIGKPKSASDVSANVVIIDNNTSRTNAELSLSKFIGTKGGWLNKAGDSNKEFSPKLLKDVNDGWGFTNEGNIAILTLEEYLDALSLTDNGKYINAIEEVATSYRYLIDQTSLFMHKDMNALSVLQPLYNYDSSKYITSDVTGHRTISQNVTQLNNVTFQTLTDKIEFGDGYTLSSINELAKKAIENTEFSSYTWSKLWIAQYSYELVLFNLNASIHGYYEDTTNEEEDTSKPIEGSKVNMVRNQKLYEETHSNFGSLYASNPLVNEDEGRDVISNMIWWMPTMGAFGDASLVALTDRGINKISDTANSPYYNFIKILYETAASFDIAYTLGGTNEFDERGYSAETLKKKLTEWESKNKNYDAETFDGNAISIGMVRSVIALDKICKLLKIPDDGWTEIIKLYRDKTIVEGCYKYINNFLVQNSLTSEKTGLNPLGMFFDVKKKSMSKEWAMGFALSSLFIPLQTNLNTAESTSYLNTDTWIKDFYYKYGFYRKGLMIDTDNSSVIDNFIKGSSGGRRPATLNDLINYKRDITLYVDDNFYNIDKTTEVINRVNDGGDVKEELNKASTTSGSAVDPQQNTASGAATTTTPAKTNTATDIVNTEKSEMFGSMLGLVPEDILKSGSVQYYKDDIARSVKRLDAVDNNDGTSTYEKFILGAKDIKKVLDEDEYSVRQPYAVVSDIYRDRELYKELARAISNDGALFRSSKAIAQMPVALPKDYGTYMNYIMLSNLEEAMDNNVGLELDKDAPIFTDIFGNIITESGTIVIPAAANATLTGDYWSPVNLGFATYYSYSNKIPVDFGSDDFKEWLTGTVEIEEMVNDVGTPNDVDTVSNSAMKVKRTEFSTKYKNHEQGSGWFVKGQNNYMLKTTTISAFDQSATIIWSTISKNSEALKKVFYKNAYYNIAPKMYSARLANHIVEVLRGAPIENIDLQKEGLSSLADVSKIGLTIAWGYEQLMKTIQPALNSSIVNMPNLAFISGVEYIILYIYKFMFAVFIVIFVFTLYINAVKKSLSPKVFFVFILTVVGTVASITIIPDVISFSYYAACKYLLRDEASYIAMLNYTKEINGVELGVTEVSTPKTSTELYMKLDNLNVDWTTIMNKVLFNKTADTLTELYKEEFDKNLVSKQPGVVQKADGLYLDLNDVLKSIEVVYNPDLKMLVIQNHSQDGNVLSYVSPYYVVLNELVNNINNYNYEQNIESYVVDENATGKVTTKDVISAYFRSPEFLDAGYDISGFHKIYQTGSPLLPANYYSYLPTEEVDISEMDLLRRSLWFPHNAGPEVIDKVDKLADYMRYYIARNKDTIGKVPDEAFLKVMALSVAMEHNKLFNVPAGKSIEIANVDVADIMRFMIGKKADVYRTYNLTYPRAVYELGGGASVVLSVLFSLIVFFATYIKPGLIILIVFMLIFNVIKEMVFSRERDGRKVLEGYLITCGLVIIVNVLYALMLTLSIRIAQLGLGTFLSLFFGMLVQAVYVAGLVAIFWYVIRDYRQMGIEAYQATFGMLLQKASSAKSRIGSRFSSWRSNRGRVLRERASMFGMSSSGESSIIEESEEVIESDDMDVSDIFGNESVRSMEERDSSRYEEAFRSFK